MMSELMIRALGRPAPQGSKTPVQRGSRVVLIETSKQLPAWRATVVGAAESAIRAAGWHTLTDDPVDVQVMFLIARPKTVTRPYPTVPPDGDKLLRAVFDALTIARVYRDDAQVVKHYAEKRYADGDALPGAIIRVRSLSPQGELFT